MRGTTDRQQFAFPRVAERWMNLFEPFHGVLSVDQIDAEVQQNGLEEVVLGAIDQQPVVQRTRS